MRRWTVVLAACLCWGCFILDEFEQGEELMRQAGSGGAKAKQKQEAEATTPQSGSSGSSEPGLAENVMDTIGEWWKKATAEPPPPPDPNDVLVDCKLAGGTQFMRKRDCILRGGAPAELELGSERSDGA